MKTSEINQLFDLLDKWRLLPAYQLERRADIFFAIYLPQILEDKLDNQPILKIIPEFPVRIGTIYPKISSNQSFKIDYLVISEKKVLLVELKTDNSSRRTKQDEYLEESSKVNIPKLMEGLIQIFKATKSKVKYSRLMKEFVDIGWLQTDGKGWKNTSEDKDIEIVYIQPVKDDKSGDKSIVSFDEIATKIETNESDLSKRFAESLRDWVKSADKKQDSINHKI